MGGVDPYPLAFWNLEAVGKCYVLCRTTHHANYNRGVSVYHAKLEEGKCRLTEAVGFEAL